MRTGLTQQQSMAAIRALVPYFRNANWYYDNYFIQKTLAGKRVNELISMKKIVDKLNVQIVSDSNIITKLQSRKTRDNVMGIVIIAVLAGTVLLILK